MPSLKDFVESDFNSNSFAPVDVESFIAKKGIEYIVSGKWLKMKCILPFGHEDHTPSFFIHKDHGGYNCYSGCGSGTWSELCTHMNWDMNLESVTVGMLPDSLWKESKQRIKEITSLKNHKEKTFHIPKGFEHISATDIHCSNHYNYLVKRNMTEWIGMFNIGYTTKSDSSYGKEYLNRIIIPCHNVEGKYIWSEGRLITEAKTDRKYYRPFGVNKIEYLFNIHRVLRKGFNWCIVAEGIVDAMNLWFWGVPAVCCFGADISDEQIEQLMVFDKVFLCLDNDPAGIKGFVKAKDKMLGTGVELYRTLLPKGQDVNNITYKKWCSIYSNSKQIYKVANLYNNITK